MAAARGRFDARTLIHVAVLCGGVAALSWEVIWQEELALAVGVSAEATALTLVCMMGGMTLGAWLMGRLLDRRAPLRPLRWYGLLELSVGVSGLLFKPALGLVAHADSALAPDASGGALHLTLLALVLGVPTMAMGASVPLLGLVARQYDTKLAHLYGFNTLGAAIGTLGLALVVMPLLGTSWSIVVVAAIDVAIFVAAWRLRPPTEVVRPADAEEAERKPTIALALAGLFVFVTGYATFALEVAWFRALRGAFLSTTYTFAILVAAVLLPLALAARVAPRLRARGGSLAPWMAGAAVAVLLATPMVERAESWEHVPLFFFVVPSRFLQTLCVVGPAMFLLGIPLPWILDDGQGTKRWGTIYAINTVGAMAGGITAAWLLLPHIGFARSAWLVGGLVGLAALLGAGGRARIGVGLAVAASIALAMFFESGVGRTRTIGANTGTLLAFRETSDFTVSVVDKGTQRVLYIDGFVATGEAADADYMVWMGRLPALLHPHPGKGLVICFGTGQTANALRREHIGALDIVDISQAVFDLAPFFSTNEDVLGVPIVAHHRVDGRSWLRRTQTHYDVITLEPMPPTFAGVNSLYSREFYELVFARLNPGGIAAQWLPFHLVDPLRGVSIATTFRAVFADSVIWVHPRTGTGILLGRRPGGTTPWTAWPGLERPSEGRTLDPDAIRSSLLDSDALGRYAAPGRVITDDNQLLAYGFDPHGTDRNVGLSYKAEHAELIRQAQTGAITLPPEPPIELWRWGLSLVAILVAGRLIYVVQRDVRRRFT